MFLSEKEAKELILSIGKSMYSKQFVTANDGNITVRTGENTVITTPTGISKGLLTSDMLITVDFDGNILEGAYRPTSEIGMHLNIYKTDNEIQSTCHSHSPYMSALACAGLALDAPTTPAAACIVGMVPVSPYFCPGSPELAESVIPYVRKYHMVNLGNHGPLTWGKTPLEAWYRMEASENAAQLAILTKYVLGKLRPLTKNQLAGLYRFHDVDITEDGSVTGTDWSENQEPSSGLYL